MSKAVGGHPKYVISHGDDMNRIKIQFKVPTATTEQLLTFETRSSAVVKCLRGTRWNSVELLECRPP